MLLRPCRAQVRERVVADPRGQGHGDHGASVSWRRRGSEPSVDLLDNAAVGNAVHLTIRGSPSIGAALRNELKLASAPSPMGQAARIVAETAPPDQGLLMSVAKLEARLLTAAELALVAFTRPPEIERQSADELKGISRRLREAHDRARAIGTRQAREMRGKAEPHGAKPATDNLGAVAKAQALREALDRVEAELRRRDAARR